MTFFVDLRIFIDYDALTSYRFGRYTSGDKMDEEEKLRWETTACLPDLHGIAKKELSGVSMMHSSNRSRTSAGEGRGDQDGHQPGGVSWQLAWR